MGDKMTSNQYNCDLWNFLNSISQQLNELLNAQQDQYSASEAIDWPVQTDCGTRFRAIKQLPRLTRYHGQIDQLAGARDPAIAESCTPSVVRPAQQVCLPLVAAFGPHSQQNPNSMTYYDFQRPASEFQTTTFQLEPMLHQQPPKTPLFDCAYCEWLAKASANQRQHDNSNVNYLNTNQLYAYLSVNNER